MKWKWIVYLRKQWLLLLIKLYSISILPPPKNMEDIITNAYTTQLTGAPFCTIGSKPRDKNSGNYESVNFFVELKGKGFLNTTISILNNDLVFTIIELKLKDVDYQYLFDLSARLNLIENDIKPKLKPYFGL